jgi:aminomuconate-semialdehyde/2-hydroxymuconate-6-semialdehyde dehydrogenase
LASAASAKTGDKSTTSKEPTSIPGLCLSASLSHGKADALNHKVGDDWVHLSAQAFVERVKKLKIGDPLVAETNIGAVVSQPHMEKILSYIDLAQEEGGKILYGGRQIKLEGRCANGYFIEPTIIEGLAHDCRTNQEEIFGPVVSIMPFDTEAEVLGYANSVRYGLSATVWTENLSRAHRVSAALDAGIVWVNCWLLRDLRTPFGGVKDSGMGREGGFEALRFFTEEKNVCVKI